MSTHTIEIVCVEDIVPHPDPEVTRMELTHIGGWQCCVGKGQFRPGDKAVYIPPDYCVPLARSEFAFLRKENDDVTKTHERIKVRKFKGTISQGLLISVPAEFANREVGSNIMAELDIIRYEPSMKGCTYSTGGMFVSPPEVYAPTFDVENFERYRGVFEPGEMVVITEKIHGANARFCFVNGEMFCGSHRNWMKQDEKNLWWIALQQNPAIEVFCKKHPSYVLYGEVFGQVQSLKYGAAPGQIFFAAFALKSPDGKWVNFGDMESLCVDAGVSTVPVICQCKYDESTCRQLAEGRTTWPGADHIREGVVVVPVQEREHRKIGRVILKFVSNEYLAKH